MPTFLAAAGEPDIVEKCKAATRSGTRPSRSTSTAYNLLPAFSNATCQAPVAAQALPVLERRRRLPRDPVRGVEGRLQGAAGARPAGLGGPLRRAAGAAHVQHPVGSVRAGPGGHLLRVVQGAAPVHRRAGGLTGSRVVDELPGVPTADEAGIVQPRPGHGAGHRACRKELAPSPPPPASSPPGRR